MGALIRLNEVGLLAKLSRISSVSGGSITSAVRGLHLQKLWFNNQGIINLDFVCREFLTPPGNQGGMQT